MWHTGKNIFTYRRLVRPNFSLYVFSVYYSAICFVGKCTQDHLGTVREEAFLSKGRHKAVSRNSEHLEYFLLFIISRNSRHEYLASLGNKFQAGKFATSAYIRLHTLKTIFFSFL